MKYLEWMLAPLTNTERLRCCQGPVAYAHRQGSVALRAKTKQPGAGLMGAARQPDSHHKLGDCPRVYFRLASNSVP